MSIARPRNSCRALYALQLDTGSRSGPLSNNIPPRIRTLPLIALCTKQLCKLPNACPPRKVIARPDSMAWEHACGHDRDACEFGETLKAGGRGVYAPRPNRLTWRDVS
jgi:hypothetical protein